MPFRKSPQRKRVSLLSGNPSSGRTRPKRRGRKRRDYLRTAMFRWIQSITYLLTEVNNNNNPEWFQELRNILWHLTAANQPVDNRTFQKSLAGNSTHTAMAASTTMVRKMWIVSTIRIFTSVTPLEAAPASQAGESGANLHMAQITYSSSCKMDEISLAAHLTKLLPRHLNLGLPCSAEN